MKKASLILIVLFGLTTGMTSRYKKMAQPSYDTQAKMKAVFLYNFTRYIDWPEAYKKGDFVVGVYGKTAVLAEINKIAATKKALSQTIKVVAFTSLSDIPKCHMLYLAAEKSDDLKTAVNKTKGSSTLVITEQNGLAKDGAGISFVNVGGRQKFELNKINIEKRNMKIGSALLSLAIQVE